MNKKLEVELEGAMNEILKLLSDYFSTKIEKYYKKKNQIVGYTALPDFLIDIEEICKHFPEYDKDDIVQSIEYIKNTLKKNIENIGTSFYMKFDKNDNPVYKQSRKGIARNYYVNRKKRHQH